MNWSRQTKLFSESSLTDTWLVILLIGKERREIIESILGPAPVYSYDREYLPSHWDISIQLQVEVEYGATQLYQGGNKKF